ncbi:MAG: prepilin-type N-terminal cleavage/methylation domain-containing protein [Candidatus Omnitrophica bacterium]|nr:prepilin-type N-terminal cleavage/methylation domain-containing protein [Candidatus Omnitrophota bacterium]
MGRQRLPSGFTLVEILIALLILALGIVGLFNIFPAAWQSFAYSRRLSRVALIAEQKMEEFKSAPSPAPGTTGGSEGDLNWTATVEQKQFESGVELLQVELDIEFSMRDTPQKERFITYISKD